MAVFPGVPSSILFPVWEIQYSLNILAYDTFNGVEAQRAANDWAGTSGLELLAALNYKDGVHSTGPSWMDFNAVCNDLAGTTGLDAQAALSNLAQTEMNMALSQVAATPLAGFALQNATPTILTWTAPNDGKPHFWEILGDLIVAVTEVGGLLQVIWTVGGSQKTHTLMPAGQANSDYSLQSGSAFWQGQADPNTSVSVVQGSALTSGSASLFAAIFAN